MMARTRAKKGSSSKGKKKVQRVIGASTRTKTKVVISDVDSDQDLGSSMDSDHDEITSTPVQGNTIDSHINKAMEKAGISGDGQHHAATSTPKAAEDIAIDEAADIARTEKPVHSSPWRDLFQHGKSNDKGLGLCYVNPPVEEGTSIAVVDCDEVKQMTSTWNKAVAFYVIGATPSIGAVVRYAAAAWPNIPNPKVQLHDDGYFLLLFSTIEDCNSVLRGGPYIMGGKPILLKKWSSAFNLHDELRIAPVWVRFPGLPVIYWGANTLSRLASILGVPLMADDFTSRQARVSYARVLIEVDITKPLPSMIKFRNEIGQVVEQRITCDWVPYFCSKCQMVGHDCNKQKQRNTRVVQKWVVKKTQQHEKTSNNDNTVIPDDNVVPAADTNVKADTVATMAGETTKANYAHSEATEVSGIVSEVSGINPNAQNFSVLSIDDVDRGGPPDGSLLQ